MDKEQSKTAEGATSTVKEVLQQLTASEQAAHDAQGRALLEDGIRYDYDDASDL
ncbi:MAG: hypothetical protein K0R67_89 [Paenibacillus sp.]|jgi:hypothetical protein|nr:hypothetical protein [Paenibacillus sp.]